MRPRGTAQQEAVARRLALLGAELEAVRGAAVDVQRRSTPDPHDHGPGPADPDPPDDREPDEGSADGANELPGATRLPRPGRHAARRPGPSLVASLQGRVGLGAPQLAVVAVLVAVGMAVAAWWVVRDRPAPIDPVAAGPIVTPSAPAVGSSTPTRQAPDVVVDVAGKVRRPGIVVLEAGARVVDALEAAGGPRRGVDLTGLNLARVLVDGEQLLVGLDPPAGRAMAGTGPPPATGDLPLVNLNTAGTSELEALPGVGPVTAQAILDWRTEHGAFASVDQLLDVSGIGEATLAEIAPHVTVG